MQRIADSAQLRTTDAPQPRTIDAAAHQLATEFERVAARAVDIRARMALTIDSLDDPEMHDLLTTRSPVRATVLDHACQLLTELDVPDVAHPRRRAAPQIPR